MQTMQILASLSPSCAVFSSESPLTVPERSPCFLIVLSGSAVLGEGLPPLQAKNILFLPPACAETLLVPMPSCTFLWVNFSAQGILDLWDKPSPFFGRTPQRTEDYTLLYRLLCCAQSTYTHPSAESGLSLSAQALLILDRAATLWPVERAEAAPARTPRQAALLKDSFSYLCANLSEAPSLSAAAQKLDVTPQYLASFLKRQTGKTFSQLLRQCRLEKAALYWRYTSLSAEECAARAGLSSIPDLAALSERPKPFLPSGRPLRFSEEHALDALQALGAKPPETPQPLHAPQTLSVPAEGYMHMPAFWKMLLNLGYATDFLDTPLFRQLQTIQNEVHFRYGRLCRPLDLVLSARIRDQKLYDFSHLFALLDDVTACGLFPFLELGNKQPQKTLVKIPLPSDTWKDPEAHFRRTLQILPEFVRACINRYGLSSFQNWRFEVSFMPEQAKVMPMRKFLPYFKDIYDCIHAYCPQCQVGGPGFRRWNTPEDSTDFLDQCRGYHFFPFFYTAYLYPLEGLGSFTHLSEDPDILLKRLDLLQERLQKNAPQLQLWITEFSSNCSPKNLLNDSCYQAAFLVRIWISCIHRKIQSLAYFLLSDLQLREENTTDMLFGGWGLFSDHDIPKPSYYAFALFAKLGSTILKRGRHYLLTAGPHGHYQCLFFHYAYLAPPFCRRNLTLRDLLSPETVFLPEPPQQFTLTLPACREGLYVVRTYTISRKETSLLAQWQKFQFLMPAHEKDYETLHMLSSLYPRLSIAAPTPQKPLTLSVTLRGEEVKLFLIEPYNAYTAPPASAQQEV